MKKYDLFDKYLTGKLTDEETDKLVELLKSEDVGQELVEYSLETKLFVEYGKKVKSKVTINSKTSSFKKVKQKKSYLPVLLLAAMLALSFLGYQYFSLKNNAVISVAGSAEVLRHGLSSTSDNNISEGDIVLALDDCDIKFEDGSSLRLEAGAKVEIQELMLNKSIFLQKGKINISAVPQELGKIKVITEDSETEVVGTEFSVQKLRKGTVLEVQEGKVKFSNSKTVVEISEGKMAFAEGNLPIIIKDSSNVYGIWRLFSERYRKDLSLNFYTDFVDGSHKGDLILGSIQKDRANRYFLRRGIIKFPETFNFKVGKEITLFSWVRAEEYSVHAPVLTKGDMSWRLQVQRGLPHVGYGGKSPQSFLDSSPKYKIDLGKWYLIHQVISQDNVKIYLNGVKITDEVIKNVSLNNSGMVMIGGNSAKKNYHFLGDIGEAGLFKRALSEEEILEMYQFGKFRN